MNNLLLQSSTGSMFGGLLSTLLGFAVVIILFFLFRNIILWYYKLDLIARSLEDQTEIQKAILRELELLKAQKKDGI